MNSTRRIAVVAGVLFIIATVADVISRAVFVQPILSAPDYLTGISANQDQVLLGALFLVIGAVAASGIAIALYPVLRTRDAGLALGSVGFRLIEGALYLGIVVCLLVLVTLGQESVNGGHAAQSAYVVPAALVMAARDSLGEVAMLAAAPNAASLAASSGVAGSARVCTITLLLANWMPFSLKAL